MDYEFRVALEKISIMSQKVVKQGTVKIYDINRDIVPAGSKVYFEGFPSLQTCIPALYLHCSNWNVGGISALKLMWSDC